MFFLLTVMLLTVGWSIDGAKWADGLWTLAPVALGGVIIGAVLGTTRRIPTLLSHLMAIVLGVAWVGFSVAWVSSLIPWDYTWGETIREMADRLLKWLEIIRNGGISSDNLIFVLHMGLLMWLVAYLSAWSLYRLHNVWVGILLSGVAIIMNLYYAAPDIGPYLLLYVLPALLLAVRFHIYEQEAEWHATRVGFNPDIGWDILRDGAIFALVTVTFAWMTPTITAAPEIYNEVTTRFEEPLNNWQSNFNRMFSSLNYRPRPGPAYFSNTLALTGAVSLGDQPVFDVKVEGGLGARYFRSVTYDQYTGRGWVNSNTSITSIDPGDRRLSTVTWNARTVVTQTVTMIQPGGSVVHAVAQPLALGLGARAQYGPTELVEIPNERPVMPLDVSLINANRVWRPGDTFSVTSAQSIASTRQLREASVDYPKWVRDKYLQLPDTASGRVLDLAKQITAPYATPFEKATAIEAYLRKIPYNESIPTPPPGRDLVDWFIFEAKEGYCDYYASAFNVMARSVGIPTRLAAGYARGEYMPELGVTRIHEYNAHSWPEVFFPDYGWIEFEPTAADPQVQRVEDPSTINPDDPSLGGLKDRSDRDAVERAMNLPPDDEMLADRIDRSSGNPGLVSDAVRLLPRLLFVPVLIIVLAGIAISAFWIIWNKDLRGLGLVDSVWEQLLRFGRMLGVPISASNTPHEVARSMGQAVPDTQGDITRIADVYVRRHFSASGSAVEQDPALTDSWLRAQRALWQQWLAAKASRLRPRRPSR
ncbi:MAG: transglutaminase domain-containing protein [Anaerolineae bacterium]|nr:transglutaminase domain-containing protein [Anaerolineae bacterium]